MVCWYRRRRLNRVLKLLLCFTMVSIALQITAYNLKTTIENGVLTSDQFIKDHGSDLRAKDSLDVGVQSEHEEEQEELTAHNQPDKGRVINSRAETGDINAPGEHGKAVHVDLKLLSPDEKKRYDEGWKRNAFNEYVSNMISLHRSLPDPRDKECLKETFSSTLPDTSVIICFHNEAYSVLLRTIHSVLDRSPPHLLKEIILVDDFSTMPHLKTRLEDYVARLGKVKIVRTKKREGLVRARLLGYSVATGQVLTYLDSHCECATGWLEPLLDRIGQNESIVVCPVIDDINHETFKYGYGDAKSTVIGGFDWGLSFQWRYVPEYEKKRRKRDIDPIRSPTMAGGLFSINRKFFTHIGTYDSGMDIWGGENLDLSFRIWMCGGSLEILPCSHVGHVFRKSIPYSWAGHVAHKNAARLAEVWLDDYKKYFYERILNKRVNFGDVSDRQKLRENLKCKSFDWYLKTVYPDRTVPNNSLATGSIRSKNRPVCVENAARTVKTWSCHNQGGNQFWRLTTEGEIKKDNTCLEYSEKRKLQLYPCHKKGGNQMWEHRKDKTIFHPLSNKCLELSANGGSLSMKNCTKSERQQWIFGMATA